MKVSKFFYPVLLWVAMAGVVSVGNQPAVLPTRRLRLADLQAKAVRGDA